MKANKKFVNDNEAVSAVIGVILMVAITVAIAATVYVYVSGILGGSPETTPSIQFTKDNSLQTLIVAQADPNNLQWGDLEVTGDGSASIPGSGTVIAGDTISNCAGTFSIRHIKTNTLVGTWTFTT